MNKKTIHIIGGGTAALFLAAALNPDEYNITIYERNKTLGRKFLVAGDGGLNLSYNEPPNVLQTRYYPTSFFDNCHSFLNVDVVRDWFRQIGIETYIGSSKRVFPLQPIKPIEVLNKIIAHLSTKPVSIKTEHEWIGFSKANAVVIEHQQQQVHLKNETVVFALGGASWPVTGSKGDWVAFFKEKNINVHPFQASNCAFEVKWPAQLIPQLAGCILKNVSSTCAQQTVLGEVTLTAFGIEGSGVYPLSPAIRHQLKTIGKATVFIDLKPVWTEDHLLKQCQNAKGNISETLRQVVKLNAATVALVKTILPKAEFTNWITLVPLLKKLPLTISGLAPIEEAISTVGGIALNEVDEHFELKQFKNHFVIGEQLDWDAPTGGYLITACFAQAMQLARYLNTKAQNNFSTKP